jgi:6-phosphogluconolactonase (cycloisomerase 2 family)
VSCVRHGTATKACRGSARTLDGATDVDVSGDGRNLYVAARVSGAVATFLRDPAAGVLTQLGGENGCISGGGADGCRLSTSDSLRGARGVAVSPDGRTVYAGAFRASALSVLRRKPAPGAGCTPVSAATAAAASRSAAARAPPR